MENCREISNSDFGFRSTFNEGSVNIFYGSFKGNFKPQVTHLEIIIDIHPKTVRLLHLLRKLQCKFVLLMAPALERPYWASRKA